MKLAFLIFGHCYVLNCVSSLPCALPPNSPVESLTLDVTVFGDGDFIKSVQFSSVAQSCLTICGPMNCSTLGLSVHHQLLEFTQTHVCRVGDAIQPSHPLSSPSPPAPDPSQHQDLFK